LGPNTILGLGDSGIKELFKLEREHFGPQAVYQNKGDSDKEEV